MPFPESFEDRRARYRKKFSGDFVRAKETSNQGHDLKDYALALEKALDPDLKSVREALHKDSVLDLNSL